MKRAQAEMIGLVLIVVLLAVGFLFYVKFAMKPASDSLQRVQGNQLGQTFINSLAKSDVTCGAQTLPLDELIRQVAAGTTRCDAEDALHAYVTGTLHATLDPWGYNYLLVFVRKQPNGKEEPIGLANFTNANYPAAQRCSGSKERSVIGHTLVPLAPHPGSVELRLMLCD